MDKNKKLKSVQSNDFVKNILNSLLVIIVMKLCNFFVKFASNNINIMIMLIMMILKFSSIKIKLNLFVLTKFIMIIESNENKQREMA